LGSPDIVEVFDGQTGSNASSWSADAAANTVTLTFADGDTNTLHFGAGNPVSDVQVAAVGTKFEISAVCFVTGTRIRTARGEVAVENLAVGDLVLTSQGRARPIFWIGYKRVRRPTPEQWPVRVTADAFGKGMPSCDLWLSPGHAVCVNAVGEVLIPIDHLINGATIAREEASEVTYWHVELESHDVLLAEGLPCESYMDAGNRDFFGRDYGRLPVVDPDRLAESLNCYARPFVNDGPILAFVRKRLSDRMKSLGWTADVDPGIHLVADGRRIEPRITGGSVRFVLPRSTANLGLCSHAFVPAEANVAEDHRRLGVALLGLRIGGVEIPLDDPRIADGLYAEERDAGVQWRWTNGRLTLPADLWAGRSGSVQLEVDFISDGFRGWRAPLSPQARRIVA
jgi:hypothetical protein